MPRDHTHRLPHRTPPIAAKDSLRTRKRILNTPEERANEHGKRKTVGDRNPRFATKPNFWEFKLGDQYNQLATPEDAEKNTIFIRWLEIV